MIPEVRTVIRKGNMTDAEYIAALEKVYIRKIQSLENEIKKRDKKIDKLEVENEFVNDMVNGIIKSRK